MKKVLYNCLLAAFFPVFLLLVLLIPKRRCELIWGTTPIISNKYWSAALRAAGYQSKTLMSTFYNINFRTDYDMYFEDLVPQWGILAYPLRKLSVYFAFLYIIRNASVVHLPFSGGPLGQTPFWRAEAYLLKWSNIKTILMPYGADAYMYSSIYDFSLRHGLLTTYPQAAKNESHIREQVIYWTKHATVIITGIMMEGMGRWDVMTNCPFCIDLTTWTAKTSYSDRNGIHRPVKILHTPNHRGFKGTEFLVKAVEELQQEGLKVELVMLEKAPNSRVRELMQEVDILAEQFIAVGYAFNAIEGMASGLPVLSNLDNEVYTRVFRRYAFLDECPIFSTTPETLKENLRLLITNPALREALGRAGWAYVEKYHSYATSQYMFGSIYDKVLNGVEIDLINLFHPLKSQYNRSRPTVSHPLIENHLPTDSPFRSHTGNGSAS